MSWLPDKDPVLGDKHSCDALELIIIPRVRDLGDGFSVRSRDGFDLEYPIGLTDWSSHRR